MAMRTQGRTAVEHGERRRRDRVEVSQPSDPLEREADRVALEVAGGSGPIVFRKDDAGLTTGPSPRDADTVRDAVGSGGEPLGASTRQFMESRLGHDFSAVRVHADDRAGRSASELRADAYTVGTDVAFAPGKYVPGTADGDRLIAHELTHVVQQGGGGTSPVVQRKPSADTAGRLPSPSAAASVPPRIKGVQASFHDLMREADEIVEGSRFHYNYVNGIYRENFKIHQVVVGQAGEEQLQNERVKDAILAGAMLAASFSPHGQAATLAVKIWQIAHKIEENAVRIGKVLTIAKAISPDKKKGDDAEGKGPAEPSELELIGLENLVSLASSLASARDAGDAVLDASVDFATQLATNAPDSGQLTKEESDALNESATLCETLLQQTEAMMAGVRALRERRKAPVPSWQEVEQDIWLAYFDAVGHVSSAQVVTNHMIDLGLWGPPGQPGGRLGVADEPEGFMLYEGSKTEPGYEDQEKQQSVGPKTMTKTQLIKAAAASLPAKWRRIMLLAD